MGDQELVYGMGRTRPNGWRLAGLRLQTNASCTVRYGDTVILATAVISKNTRDGIDFSPRSWLHFEEKLYAAGKIKGSRFIAVRAVPPKKLFPGPYGGSRYPAAV